MKVILIVLLSVFIFPLSDLDKLIKDKWINSFPLTYSAKIFVNSNANKGECYEEDYFNKFIWLICN